MKGRLLFCMLLLCVMMLVMYYMLIGNNPGLVGGFITMIAVFITQIVNIAEDILQDMFKADKKPSPTALEASTGPQQGTIAASTAIVLVLCLLFVPGSAWAHGGKSTVTNTTVVNNTVVNPTAIVVTEKVQAGAMVDAPHLVRIYGDWYLGAEGGKDMVYTNTSKGWFGYLKITYEGMVLTLFKSKAPEEQD